MPLTGEATTYYVKTVANGGSDGAAGTSWATAWATIAKINSTLVAGDTVRFGSGEWESTTIVPPAGGDNDHWTVYACSTYSTATQNFTHLYGGIILDGTWTVTSDPNIWWYPFSSWYDGSPSYGLGQDNVMLLTVSDTLSMSAGTQYESVSENRIYAWCVGNADPNDEHMIYNIGYQCPVEMNVSGISHVEFFGLDLSYGSPACVYHPYYRSDSVFVRHCNLRQASGYTGWNVANILCEQIDGFNIEGNVHWFNAVACSLGNNMCENSNREHVWCTYGSTYNVADSCYFNNSGDGFYVKNIGSAFATLTIGNVVKNCYFGSDLIVGFQETAHVDACSLYANIFDGCQTAINIGGSYSWPYVGRYFIGYNTFWNCEVGIKWLSSFCAPESLCVDSSYVCGDYCGEGYENVAKHCGYDNVIANNILADDTPPGSSEGIITLMYGYQNHCFDELGFDYNLYWFDEGAYEKYVCRGVDNTFATWQSTGFDVNGTADVNPGLHDPDNDDYFPDSLTWSNDSVFIGYQWFGNDGAIQLHDSYEPPEPPATNINSSYRGGHIRGGKIQ